MGLRINLHIDEWTADVDFDKMNSDLMNESSGVAELYDEYIMGQNGFDGMFKKKGKKILTFCRDEGNYVDYGPEVWSCFDDDALKSIAKHVTEGRIVFHVEIEGNQDEYWILENGKRRKGKVSIS